MADSNPVRVLDVIRDTADKATEGWVLNPERTDDEVQAIVRLEARNGTVRMPTIADDIWYKPDAEFIAAARTAVPAMERALRAVLEECAKSDDLSRRIWDGMTDYADIGDPKGPYPDNAQCSVNRLRRAIAAALEGINE